MVPAISLGTILRNRYIIQKILGQGGFGRTYLALDQERFNELCVLKEFVVPFQDASLIEKAKILFQREANTLYQLHHPQIPRFWAAFEDSQRLFLVQDFVEGKTYRHLLEEYKKRGKVFSEMEVLHLLKYLLPVLNYIHDRTLIHRDISPENIILQVQDNDHNVPVTNLPFLIDFGSVKAIAGCIASGSDITRVGKMGYAPPEQLQTGKVFPHSDLYALAATCLTLLTGREPRQLLDSQTLVWQWQPYTNMNDRLATVLQRMLSIQPGDRYQSAKEVWEDLHSLIGETLPSTVIQKPKLPFSIPSLYNNWGSYSANYENQSQTSEASATAILKLQSEQPLKQQPYQAALKQVAASWVGISIGTLVSVMFGVGMATFGLNHIEPLASLSNAEKSLQGTLPKSNSYPPNNTVSSTSVSSLYLSPSNTSVNVSPSLVSSSKIQPIRFAPGEISAVLQDRLQDYGEKFYVLRAAQGQIMTVSLDGSGVVMNLLRSNQQEIDAASHQTRSWTGQLPTDDHYLIQVSGSGVYSLDVAITPSAQTTQPNIEQITFARGTQGATIASKITQNEVRRYALRAQRGQVMGIQALQGTLRINAIAPNGQPIGSLVSPMKNWRGQLPADGNYLIEITSKQRETFKIAIEVF
jgi:serine/threonine protein kinase